MIKNISCEEVMSKLYTYLDSEVDGPTEEEINHHLHYCRECFSRAEFEKLLKRKVAKSGEKKIPDDVQNRLTELVRSFGNTTH